MSEPLRQFRRASTQPACEPFEVAEHMNFNLGLALESIWRAGLKSGDVVAELKRARWYIDRELARLGGGA